MKKASLILVGMIVLSIGLAGCGSKTIDKASTSLNGTNNIIANNNTSKTQQSDNTMLNANTANSKSNNTQVQDKSTSSEALAKSDSKPSETQDNKEEQNIGKAIELVKKKHSAKYNTSDNSYSIDDNPSSSVVFKSFGKDEKGRYEIRICPSYYPLSVFNYCYVDINTGKIEEKP